MNFYRLTILVMLVFSSSCVKTGENRSLSAEKSITGKVIHIIDGDTYDILTEDKQTIRIRMEGIDAPERGMAFYRVSKNYLGELCMGKILKIVQTDTDQYNRLVAWSYLPDGRELGHEMIKAGMAWHFKKYNSDKDLAKLEYEARSAKCGLWQDAYPIAPWEHRKQQRGKVNK